MATSTGKTALSARCRSAVVCPQAASKAITCPLAWTPEIGPPGAHHPNLTLGDTLKRLFQLSLNSTATRLDLETQKVGAIVLDCCPVAQFHVTQGVRSKEWGVRSRGRGSGE